MSWPLQPRSCQPGCWWCLQCRVKEHALQGNVEIVGVCHGLCSLALVSQGAGGACNVGLRCMFLAVTHDIAKPLLSVLECESPREHEGLDAVPLELCARLEDKGPLCVKNVVCQVKLHAVEERNDVEEKRGRRGRGLHPFHIPIP